jgi:extracellular elastinolytic metalloproteinase
MIGGGTGKCLQTNEAAGLGEGWSDALADWVWNLGRSPVADFGIGGWASGLEDSGIRSHLYSTGNATNPLTYRDIEGIEDVHDIGEVWAQTLHNVHAALVHDFGATQAEDAMTNPDGNNGHAIWLRLYVHVRPLFYQDPSSLIIANFHCSRVRGPLL